jgi:hypothetical protein
MDTRKAALAGLEQVFALIEEVHRDRGVALPKHTTEIVHALARSRDFQRVGPLGFGGRRQTGSHERWLPENGSQHGLQVRCRETASVACGVAVS